MHIINMEYNFDEIIDRKGTGSLKWDVPEGCDVLPMWIADMDFKTSTPIAAALSAKIAEGIYGYSKTPSEFYNAIVGWWDKRHGYLIEKQWVVPTAGSQVAIFAAIRAMSLPGDGIIIQTPVYNGFFTLIENSGRQIVENRLVNTNGTYEIDFDDLDRKASKQHTSLLLLCSPQNPIGRVWKKDELERIASICAKHDVRVIADEAFADLTLEGHVHYPFMALGSAKKVKAVICSSPGKSFNLSGLQTGYLVCPNQEIRALIEKQLELLLSSPNSLAIVGLISAYDSGMPWLEAVKKYIFSNYLYLQEFCGIYLPQITVSPLEAGYLVWLDCSKTLKTSEQLSVELLEEVKLWINPGSQYKSPTEGFLRINVACPRSILSDGLNRLMMGRSFSMH